MSMKAPTNGEPNRVETAAKLPAAPMTMTACWGASFLSVRMASTPRPAPMAMSGASGPSTTPRAKVMEAATKMPGSSMGSVDPKVGPGPACGPPARAGSGC